MNNFENMTIGELRKLTEQYKAQNPNAPTAQELLDELAKEKEVLNNHWSKK